MESSNRRLTLFEQMSAVDNGRNNLAGLTLEAVLGNFKRTEPPPSHNRTLLDIIREDGSNKDRDKKSWKHFRDKLRLKRTGLSSVPVPASDVNVHGNRSQFSRRDSSRSNSAESTRGEGASATVSNQPVGNSRLQSEQRGPVRFEQNPSQTDHNDLADVSIRSDSPSSRSFRPPNSSHQSNQLPSSNTAGNEVDSSDDDDDSPVAREGTRRLGAALEEERALSAREAVAAQEAAASSAAAAENNAPPPQTIAAEEPLRLSLMDLLEETDRRMGLSGPIYTMGDDDDNDYYDHEEEEEEEEQQVVVKSNGGMEYTCCVCMIRHKGSAFIPCGHTFCRLCSRELWVQRGNCPLCNGFILEILDIF